MVEDGRMYAQREEDGAGAVPLCRVVSCRLDWVRQLFRRQQLGDSSRSSVIELEEGRGEMR